MSRLRALFVFYFDVKFIDPGGIDFFQHQSYSVMDMFTKDSLMIAHRFLLAFIFVLCFMQPLQVRAQNCDVQQESIIKLRAPSFGAHSIWDAIHGEIETGERFKTALVIGEVNTVFVAGERVLSELDERKVLIFSEIGRNGRVLWEKQHDVSGLVDVKAMVKHPEGVMVMANIQPASKGGRPYIWIGIANIQGELLSQTSVKGGKAHLIGHDLVKAQRGKSYVLSAFSEVQDSGQAGSTVLYRLNSKGVVLSDQAFVIGSENALLDLHVMENGDYIGAGYVYDAYGRKAGWIMRMNNDLRMIWQQSYSRGAGAELVAGYPMLSGTYALTGTVLPAREGHRGGWLMVVEAGGGAIAWQRYFTEGLHLEGRDVITRDDGIISVLLDGQKPEETEMKEHVRLLTLNPRGVLFSSDAYFNAEAVDAYQILPGAQLERLIIGSTEVMYQIEKDKEEDAEPMLERSLEAWIIAAEGADVYDDPCKIKPRTLP